MFPENFEGISERCTLYDDNFGKYKSIAKADREKPLTIPKFENENDDLIYPIKISHCPETLMLPTLENCDILNTEIQLILEEDVIIEPSPVEPVVYHTLFIKYVFKASLVYVFSIICLKYLQNVIKRYCYATCDCSDENMFVKIWSLFLIANCIGHQTLSLYLTMPELWSKNKNSCLIHIGTSTIILLLLAPIVSGQTQITFELRVYGLMFQVFCFFVGVGKFLKQSSLMWTYIKTEGTLIILEAMFYLIFVNFASSSKEFFMSYDYEQGIGYVIFIFFIMSMFRYYFMWMIQKLKVIKGDPGLLNEKLFMFYLMFGMIFWGYIIGFMIEGKAITSIFYFFLTWYLISSIHMQTNIFNYLYGKSRYWVKKCFSNNDDEVELTIMKKSESEKLFAGMKIIFTILIMTKFFTIIIIKQWMEFYNYTTEGCAFHISEQIISNLNTNKIAIFFGLDIIVDVLCFVYHKKTSFANVFYFVPKTDYILQGIAFYFPVFLFERIIQKIWYIY